MNATDTSHARMKATENIREHWSGGMRRIGCESVWDAYGKIFPEDARDEIDDFGNSRTGKKALMIQVIKSLAKESRLFVINISEERRKAKWYMKT